MILKYLYFVFENDFVATTKKGAQSSSSMFHILAYEKDSKRFLQYQIVNSAFTCLSNMSDEDEMTEKVILIHCILELVRNSLTNALCSRVSVG